MIRRSQLKKFWLLELLSFLLGLSCSDTPFILQPNTEVLTQILRFTVTQPQQADFLVVVDNSASMKIKQEGLLRSFKTFLQVLSSDADIRIGITSTDAHGFLVDCNNQAIAAEFSNSISDPNFGGRGNCQRPEVVLARPHDGTYGRLIAAYDPQAFAVEQYGLNAMAAAAFKCATPRLSPLTTASDCLVNANIRHVIDLPLLKQEASLACCQQRNGCDANVMLYCVEPVAAALAQAYFQSNLNGLGQNGFAWEQGLLTALWAVGIDPTNSADANALAPAYNLLAPGAPNTASFLDTNGNVTDVATSWVRDMPATNSNTPTALGLLFLSDEQDCSMLPDLLAARQDYEDLAALAQPTGSMCYQPSAQWQFLSPARMINLLATQKGDVNALFIGVIAGVTAAGTASDCAINPSFGAGNSNCACLSANMTCATCDDANVDNRWCAYTSQSSSSQGCDALAASRYTAFAAGANQHVFASICNSSANNSNGPYAAAMMQLALLTTNSCFGLNNVVPIQHDPNAIVVRRQNFGTAVYQELRNVSDYNSGAGWVYEAATNRICLVGRPRIVNDSYEVQVITARMEDFSQSPAEP